MPLIDRAWKVSVNVWKRHLNLQSVFNHGECMMREDKNTNSHVLDQNVDRILREIAYVPLSGRIRFKRSSCMQPFFFLKKKGVQDMLTNDLMDLKFWTCFREVRGFEIWTCFLEVRGFEFGRASQRSNRLKFGRASQRSTDLNLDVLPRGPRIWILDVLPRDPMVWF